MAVTAKCQHKCSGDHACGCNGAIKHTLHICRNPHCVCHTAHSYGLEPVQGVYIHEGAALVRKAREQGEVGA